MLLCCRFCLVAISLKPVPQWMKAAMVTVLLQQCANRKTGAKQFLPKTAVPTVLKAFIPKGYAAIIERINAAVTIIAGKKGALIVLISEADNCTHQ